MAGNPRYRFVLIEEPENRLPVRYRRYRRHASPAHGRRVDPMTALFDAFAYLDLRGEGFEAWAPALSENPLAFLLDALEDAVLVREAGGRLLYRNRAARRLPLPREADDGEARDDLEAADDEVLTEHRRMSFRWGRAQIEIEVIRPRGR